MRDQGRHIGKTVGVDRLADVAEHRARGGAVLLSSHLLGEVERLADRVTIIRDGRTIESGDLAGLRLLRHADAGATLEELFLQAYR